MQKQLRASKLKSMLSHQTLPALLEKGRGSTLLRIITLLLCGSWLEQELKSWYINIATGSARFLYTELPVENAASDDVFPTMLRFESFKMFRMHSFYWSALMLLYNSIHEVCEYSYESRYHLRETIQRHEIQELSPETRRKRQKSLGPFTASRTNSDVSHSQDLHMKSVSIATLLAESINFFLSRDMRNPGIHSVCFPLRVALHVLSQQPGPEAAWCRQKFDVFERRGFSLAKALSETQWDDFPVLLS